MYVYLLSNDFIKFKIGSSKHPKKRVKELQTGNGDYLTLVKTYVSVKYYKQIEHALHNTYAYKHKIGEWYLLEDIDVTNFESTCKSIEDSLIFLQENKI